MALPSFNREGYLATGRAMAPAFAIVAFVVIGLVAWVSEASALVGWTVTIAGTAAAYVICYLLWPALLVSLVGTAIRLLLLLHH
ncbi:MAG: hypothetical protein INR62_13620 [Rhodospirillales bacterium]|nr:hypothetical protein [Acetobacter sp.]